MSQQRLEELDEIAHELYILKGIDVNSPSIVYKESVKHVKNKEEHKYLFYVLCTFRENKPNPLLLNNLAKDVLRDTTL